MLLVAPDQQWNPGNIKVKTVDLIQGAFAKSEWTRQLPHGFKWNCIKACPAILSTGSQCELCWKIYFGEPGLSIQREKTECCSDINQTRTLWWLCYTSRRSWVHGLKQAIWKKKVQKNDWAGCRLLLVSAISSVEVLERYPPPVLAGLH